MSQTFEFFKYFENYFEQLFRKKQVVRWVSNVLETEIIAITY